jgi:hypothetical protein
MKEVSISEERPIFCCYKVVSKDNRVAALMPVGVDSTANGLLPRTIEARLDAASNYIYVGDQRVFWYKYGFVSDETYKTAQFVVTKEWGQAGRYQRKVHGLRCMFDRCTLLYDGVEHGMFRWSLKSMFGNELFYIFDEMKISQRYMHLPFILNEFVINS